MIEQLRTIDIVCGRAAAADCTTECTQVRNPALCRRMTIFLNPHIFQLRRCSTLASKEPIVIQEIFSACVLYIAYKMSSFIVSPFN